MADLSAPSFSLGFDLDTEEQEEEEAKEEEADHPLPRPSPDEWKNEGEESFRQQSAQDSEDFEGAENLDEGREADVPIRVFKRLRRGPPPPPPPPPLAEVDGSVLTNESTPLTNIYDEIEDFSSPEKVPQRFCTDDYPSTQSHTTCSTSKFSLLHRGFLREHSDGKKIASKVAPASIGAPTSTTLGASNLKNPFPRLTISPIRKINLIDSDSDDSPNCKDDYKKNKEAVASLERKKWFHEKVQKESFWKDFTPEKNEKFATPALDEFCNEYFMSAGPGSVKNLKSETLSSGCSSSRGLVADDVIDIYDDLDPCKHISGEVCMNWDLSSPQPPSYRYFYHTDPRIRALVHQRLPYFIPLGTKNNGESQQFGAKILDYMSQFNSTEANGKPHAVSEKASRSSSCKKQNKQSRYSVKEASNSTASWVNPKSKASIPKDVGKRRVSADVHQSGQWFTDHDGKKVYVSKNGEQSTGRMAYVKYKKESGGFRKTKKKAAAKKSKKRKR
ncbi:hypothetical protein KSP39_PZI016940 [Platanthera zijinensis]|uniref:Uncharacterized protein n=1 Tax=Platanthera zijinensis TaxID=2320716 RepID=A0AAP0G0V5_9ASPA